MPKALSEAELLKKLMIDGSKLGLRLFRNQQGVYELKDGRWLTSGLCVGSSDLIGYYPGTMTEAIVGRTVAVFVAVEAKGPRGRPTKEQEQFVDVVNRAGGLGYVAWYSDLELAIQDWMAR